jgi:hypothetical protein
VVLGAKLCDVLTAVYWPPRKNLLPCYAPRHVTSIAWFWHRFMGYSCGGPGRHSKYLEDVDHTMDEFLYELLIGHVFKTLSESRYVLLVHTRAQRYLRRLRAGIDWTLQLDGGAVPAALWPRICCSRCEGCTSVKPHVQAHRKTSRCRA